MNKHVTDERMILDAIEAAVECQAKEIIDRHVKMAENEIKQATNKVVAQTVVALSKHVDIKTNDGNITITIRDLREEPRCCSKSIEMSGDQARRLFFNKDLRKSTGLYQFQREECDATKIEREPTRLESALAEFETPAMPACDDAARTVCRRWADEGKLDCVHKECSAQKGSDA